MALQRKGRIARIVATAIAPGTLWLAPCVASGAAHAQAADRKLCAPASHALDAVTAAPGSHRVLFEDEHVRVLEIVLPPLAVEPVHIHALPSVITGDTGGAAGARFLYISYEYRNGKFVETETRDIIPTPGQRTVWAPPEGPHSIANVGAVPVKFTRMEIKPEACAR